MPSAASEATETDLELAIGIDDKLGTYPGQESTDLMGDSGQGAYCWVGSSLSSDIYRLNVSSCRIIPSLSDTAQLVVRVAAYRLLRYVMAHADGPELFNNFDGKDLGWFVVR